MSGYRSLHREQVLDNTALWNVKTTALLLDKKNSNNSSNKNAWRIWAACADGLLRAYVAQETSLQDKQDVLDASALRLHCTHILVGSSQEVPSQSSSIALGCSRVCLARNYVGEDDSAGDLIVQSLDLAGRVRVWCFGEGFDDNYNNNYNDEASRKHEPRLVKARTEFEVENATGTTAELSPPRVAGARDVFTAIGCLDGTISIVSIGLATPTQKNEPSAAGTVLDTWGSRGSAIPLVLCWHPKHSCVLAVGRQDGVIDILTERKKNQHRLSRQHRSPVRALAFTDDGHLLIGGSDEGLLCIWDVSRKVPALVHHVLQAHKGWIFDVTSLSDSRRFVTAGADKRLHVWNVEQMNQGAVHTFQTDHAVWTVQRGPGNGNANNNLPRLATGSDSGWMQIFSLEN